MSAYVETQVNQLSQFALDVAEGLGSAAQKKLSPRYFYDDLGSALFEAITVLPEYGLTRADERLLREHADEIANIVHSVELVAELGSGSGKKTRAVLQSLGKLQRQLIYRPIDVSAAALAACEREISDVAFVETLQHDWAEGLAEIGSLRSGDMPMLLLFLGSSIGNLDRSLVVEFLVGLRSQLRSGDYFVLGADLVKDVETMLTAYDDPTGVTAAFNLNVLGRMNRDLGAHFDLRAFAHEARWNSDERRIEMHLLSGRSQRVYIEALDTTYNFNAGETIWTESSHKFSLDELNSYANASGFKTISTWVDEEWPFAEVLWLAV